MAPSRKTQPDRPIWPVAPDSGRPVPAGARTARGPRAEAPVSGNGRQTAGTTTPSDGFGSFEG